MWSPWSVLSTWQAQDAYTPLQLKTQWSSVVDKPYILDPSSEEGWETIRWWIRQDNLHVVVPFQSHHRLVGGRFLSWWWPGSGQIKRWTYTLISWRWQSLWPSKPYKRSSPDMLILITENVSVVVNLNKQDSIQIYVSSHKRLWSGHSVEISARHILGGNNTVAKQLSYHD